MLNRDQIAHEYMLAIIGMPTNISMLHVEKQAENCFVLADAMIAEAEKRKNIGRSTVLDEWVSVESEYPPNGIRVMIYDTEVGVCSGRWHGECWYLEGDIYTQEYAKVTHWQPLPTAPKGNV